ncbi:hypothetical protein BN1200_740064 [Klebsiella variicola]|nr:hypothetical protein BN1200_740064 [Klebsiella variicola]
MSQGVKRTLLTSICINLWGAGQGDYISVQKDHTLSGCSCTFQSVSEALAEPACRVQVRFHYSPVYVAHTATHWA